MNDTYLHITLTHFPIVGSFISLVLLLVGWLRKNHSLINAALILIVVLAMATFFVNHTGEEAEEFVEHLPGFSHHAIHEHEEAAELAFYAMEATGLLALVSIFLLRRNAPKGRMLVLLALIGNLVTFGFMARAGKMAGYIHHTEVYPEAAKTE